MNDEQRERDEPLEGKPLGVGGDETLDVDGETPESDANTEETCEIGGDLSQAIGPDSASTHPRRVGRYRVLQVLGEGGMGVVYLVEQEHPVRRRVALKLVKLGMDSREIVARFEAERQALAMMSHPNIARVYDAGTSEEGRPFFVMEYVPGEPISSYCDRHRLETRARLELFANVCRAVQHAHQKAVIHRDLKPSNILVMKQDDVPVPKIIDFGIAKATDHRLTEKTVFTELGRIIGTPEYMSPEQTGTGAQDIDIRTDVYSLGVILYELLVGELPFDSQSLRSAGYAEIQRIICEETPPKPSTRVGSGGSTAKAAEKRRSQPSTLTKIIRGDLDWITMKALEKERERRYASAAELAGDISRHLANEPVQAGPPSTAYRMHKFFKRHRGRVSGAVTAVLALFGALLYWWVQPAVISVDSQPSGARVFVDGASVGLTPLLDYDLDPGRYWIRVEKEGFLPYEQSMTLDRGRKSIARALTGVNGQLEIESRPSGAKVTVTSAAGGQVGSGVTPTRLQLPGGSYRVRMVIPAAPPIERQIEVPTGDETVVVSEQWATGRLDIESLQRGVHIQIRREREEGVPPIVRISLPLSQPIELPEGSYSVYASLSGCYSKMFLARVRDEKTTTLGLELPAVERMMDLKVGNQLQRFAVADLDGDGFVEFVLVHDGQEISAVRQDGSTVFRRRGDGHIGGPYLYDLDGDGDVEILHTGFDGQGVGGPMGGLFATGDDGEALFNRALGAVNAVLLEDVDRDGKPELLVGGSSLAILEVDGQVRPNRSRASENGYVSSLSVADLDDDGVNEILVVDSGALRTFTPQLEPGFVTQIEEYPGSTIITDLDGDAIQEVVVMAPGRGFQIVGGDGSKLWEHRFEGECSGLIPVDLDGNGTSEVLVASDRGDVAVFSPTGEQRFGVRLPTGVRNLDAFDFDGDGTREILTGSADGELTIIDSQGETRFLASVGSPVLRLLTTDLNGDGEVEIIAGASSGRVVSLSPRGVIQFDLTVDGSIIHTSTTDLDGDGRHELLVATAAGEIIGLRLEDSAFQFSAGENIKTVLVTDLDHDGDSETVVGTELRQVFVLRSDGIRTFEASVEGEVRMIVVANIDNAGADEILVGSWDWSHSYLTVFSSDGTLRFQVEMESRIDELKTIDSDEDGHLEIYVDTYHNKPSIYRADGSRLEGGVPLLIDLDGDGTGAVLERAENAITIRDQETNISLALEANSSLLLHANLDGVKGDDIVMLENAPVRPEPPAGAPPGEDQRPFTKEELSRQTLSAYSADSGRLFSVPLRIEIWNVRTENIDGDGTRELIVDFANSGGHRVINSDGTTRFELREVRIKKIIDLDNDQVLEFLCSNPSRFDVVNADGTTRFRHSIGQEISWIEAHDLDSDSKLELLVQSNVLDVLSPMGRRLLRADVYANSPVLTDLNEDGILEILAIEYRRRAESPPKQGWRLVAYNLEGEILVERRFPEQSWGAEVSAHDLDGNETREILLSLSPQKNRRVLWILRAEGTAVAKINQYRGVIERDGISALLRQSSARTLVAAVPQLEDSREAQRALFVEGLGAAEAGEEQKAAAIFRRAGLQWHATATEVAPLLARCLMAASASARLQGEKLVRWVEVDDIVQTAGLLVRRSREELALGLLRQRAANVQAEAPTSLSAVFGGASSSAMAKTTDWVLRWSEAQDAPPLALLAYALHLQGNDLAAVRTLERAMEVIPQSQNDPGQNWRKFASDVQNKEAGRLRREAQRSRLELEKNPENVEARSSLRVTLENLESFAGLRSEHQRFLLDYTAFLHFVSGRSSEAVRTLETMARKHATNRNTNLDRYRRAALPDLVSYDSIEWVLSSSDDSAERRKQLEAFRSSNTADEERIAYFEGRLAQLAGRHDDAATSFRRVLELDRSAPLPFVRLNISLQELHGSNAIEFMRSEIADRVLPEELLPLPPRLPNNLGPTRGAVVDPLTSRLQVSEFEHVDPRVTHRRTRWQIRHADGDYESSLVYEAVTPGEPRHLDLPPGLFLPRNTYFFRVSFEGSNGVASAFGEETDFVTGAADIIALPFDLQGHFDTDLVANRNLNLLLGERFGYSYTVDGFDGRVAVNPKVRGLPEDRRIGVHLLGDYRRPNAIRFWGAARDLKIDVPPRRYLSVHCVVAGIFGDSSIKVRFEYADGSSEMQSLPCDDWSHRRSEQGDWDSLFPQSTPIRGKMDGFHITKGFVPSYERTLFEVILPVHRDRELTRIAIVPGRLLTTSRRPPGAQFHLFAITGIALGEAAEEE